MLKESILLVASTGMLIYIFAPSDAPTAPDPAKVEVQKKAEPLAPPSIASWDNDDVGAGEDSFTFGEPVTFEDGETDPTPPDQLQPAGSMPTSSRSSRARSSNNSTASSRRPGSAGSIENPLAAPPTQPPPIPAGN